MGHFAFGSLHWDFSASVSEFDELFLSLYPATSIYHLYLITTAPSLQTLKAKLYIIITITHLWFLMEKNSLSNSLKDHSIGSRACNNSSSSNNSSNKQIKYPWNYSSTQNYGEDYLGGFSWPPRSYTCSFCKREFRSAQALGGHMNVHRRDRARLRQSPPSRDGQSTVLNLNINPNPNNPTMSSPYTCMLVPSSAPSIPPPATTTSTLSSPSCGSSSETKKWAINDALFHDPISLKNSDLTKSRTRKSFLDAEEFNGITQEDGCKFLKKAEIVRLDLEIGLLSDDSKEELDLELRLGCS